MSRIYHSHSLRKGSGINLYKLLYVQTELGYNVWKFIDLSSKVKSHIPADILEASVDGRHNPIGTVTSCGTALEFNVFTLHPLLPLAWDNSWLCNSIKTSC
jgi:hypothetical protein